MYLTLAEAGAYGLFKGVRLVATDMDGTLTIDGKFTPNVIQALENLAAANIQVVIVTGRSAGWVSGIAALVPVAGAIAENGGLFFSGADSKPIPLLDLPDFTAHRQQLATIFAQLKCEFPQLQESRDNIFRFTDWTFDVAGLTESQLEQMAGFCLQRNWGFTYSSVQCHIKPIHQEKSLGLQKVLSQFFSGIDLKEVVTIGDSPNDQSLFNSELFPLSVGVANIASYLQHLDYQPVCLATASEGLGFCQLVELILCSQKGVFT